MLTPEEKMKLIDELIRENPDYTIRDYLDWLEEFDRIAGKVSEPKPKKETVIWSFTWTPEKRA